MSDEIRLRYVGNGFLPGVPARDFTEAETREHGGVREFTRTGLYESVATSAAKSDKEDKPAAEKAGKDGE